MWFEIILVFILFKFKKTSQQFRNSGCISRFKWKSFQCGLKLLEHIHSFIEKDVGLKERRKKEKERKKERKKEERKKERKKK